MSSDNSSLAAIEVTGYKILELIGQGKYGKIYRSLQLNTQQIVAIKLLQIDHIDDPDKRHKIISQFQIEAQICALLQHPNIVSLLDKVEQNNHYFLVFEFIPGQTLKDFLVNESLSATEAKELMLQVLDALICAHSHNIIHRDLTPSNIMVWRAGTRLQAKMLDFGIGSLYLDMGFNEEMRTITQEIVGTPAYCAPEQLRGDPPSFQTDLYAWGLVFVECLTKSPVMGGNSTGEIVHKQLSAEKVPIPSFIRQHPIANLLRRVLAKNQNERPKQSSTIYNDLKQLDVTGIVSSSDVSLGQTDSGELAGLATEDDISFQPSLANELRQITVLCCSISLSFLSCEEIDVQVYETLQRDQINLCVNIALGYGGYLAGSLGNSLMIYFGYPLSTDNDPRLAARTALEVMGQAYKRNALLETQHNFRIEIQIGMHTGMIVAKQGVLPSGLTPTIAQKLENLAHPGTILASDISRQLLNQYIEFENFDCLNIPDKQHPLNPYLLISERSEEALLFQHRIDSLDSFAGRQKEIVQLLSYWQKALHQQGNIVLITGEPGIGKSRLLRELHQSVVDPTMLVRDARCLPEYKYKTLHPILDILSIHFKLQATNTPELASLKLRTALKECDCDIESALSILCFWFFLPQPSKKTMQQLAPDKQKKILFDVTKQLIVNISKQQPLLLIFEDIHWADPSSLEFFEQFQEPIRDAQILLILTSRLINDAPIQSNAINKIVLGKLSEREAEKIIIRVTGNSNIDPATLSEIIVRTDGIPLYIEELTRVLIKQKQLIEHDGVLSFNTDNNKNIIPVTLRDSLIERLDLLGSAKETAQMAATIGREFDYDLLVLSCVKDETVVQADLEKIIYHELIYRIRSAKGERYVFKHALVRDAAYEAMLFSNRQQAHDRVVQALELRIEQTAVNQEFSLYSIQLASHHEMAGNTSKAIKIWTTCAQHSADIAAHSEACQQYGHAIRLLDSDNDNVSLEKELQLRKQQSASLLAVYGWASTQAEQNATLILDISNLKNENLSITEYWIQFTNALNLHDLRQAKNILFSVHHNAVNAHQNLLYPLMQGMQCFYTGDLDSADDYLSDSLQRYTSASRVYKDLISCDVKIFIFAHIGWVKFLLGHEEYAHRLLTKAQNIASNNPFFEALALTFHCAMCLFTHHAEFYMLSEQCNHLSMSGGFSILEGVSRVFIGQLKIDRDLIEEGLEDMVFGLKKQSFARHRLFACVYYAKLAQNYIDFKNDLSNAQHYLDLGFEHANEQFGSFFKPELYRIQAQIYVLKGEHNSARQSLKQGLDFALYLSPKASGAQFFMQRLSALQAQFTQT